MRRAIVSAASLGALSAALAGCGSLSSAFGPGGGFLSSEPPSVTVQLDSRPPGAQATTSVGPACRTPCTIQVPTVQGFSVTFTLDRYAPMTVPVEVVTEGTAEFDEGGDPKRIMGEPRPSPNPVFAALEPSRPAKGKASPKRQPAAAPPPQAAKRAVAPPADSGFPPPPGGSAFPSR
jgi:hypothetical protein